MSKHLSPVVPGGGKRSPLYTNPQTKIAKMQIIREHGKDADGAYRAYARIDAKGNNKCN